LTEISTKLKKKFFETHVNLIDKVKKKKRQTLKSVKKPTYKCTVVRNSVT